MFEQAHILAFVAETRNLRCGILRFTAAENGWPCKFLQVPLSWAPLFLRVTHMLAGKK